MAHLRAALDGSEVTIPWRELRDREQWSPDWQRLPPEHEGGHGVQKLETDEESR